MTSDGFAGGPSRRQAFQALAALGVGTLTFQRALAAQVAAQPEAPAGVTAEMIRQAEWISGITLSEADRKGLVSEINGTLRGFAALRKVPVSNAVAPAVAFDPAPWLAPSCDKPARPVVEPPARPKPDKDEDLAFLPLTALAALVRTKQVSSVELTRLYLERLHRYDKVLHNV